MSSSDLVRRGGWAGMLSGLTFVAMFLIQLVIAEPLPGSFLDVLVSGLFIVALLAMLVGLAGFHTLQQGDYGRIGRAGFYTVVVAALVQILAQVVLVLSSTAAEVLDLVGLVGLMVGFVLYGAATLQARVLPPWCGVGFMVGLPIWVILAVVLGGFGGTLGGILFGLLWLALGYTLWSRMGIPADRIARVS